ncbi:polysaccharide export outer membrane protein [Natronocella acetinitrilica]|uniref:Polysaccharide export outer membrane protein n=1 Tax=Natronocella acetinitrilica TaxID=414046 RepID=A0AAE3KCN8_9GAMM|nr:XrtA/PEP-CTERM system exopolysaccharide export protein [Natronocella acetinitrilica]MCP1677135.1 polysaccharide export outer membrane protein [Natronocella acetinitrilica]
MGWAAFSRLALVGLVALAVSACGGFRSSDIPSPGPVETPDYVIGAGDQLQIYVRNNPDLSVSLPVRPDGKISVPMVQDVQAAGKTPTRLGRDLETELAQFIREPTVTVMVMGFVGEYADQVRVIGQAAQPQSLAYRNGMTVLDALIQVGGLTPFAAGNRATLVRQRNGDSSSYRLRLNDLLNDGDVRHNHALRPGDIIIIPEAYF